MLLIGRRAPGSRPIEIGQPSPPPTHTTTHPPTSTRNNTLQHSTHHATPRTPARMDHTDRISLSASLHPSSLANHHPPPTNPCSHSHPTLAPSHLPEPPHSPLMLEVIEPHHLPRVHTLGPIDGHEAGRHHSLVSFGFRVVPADTTLPPTHSTTVRWSSSGARGGRGGPSRSDSKLLGGHSTP